jgi:hypothetical protein
MTFSFLVILLRVSEAAILSLHAAWSHLEESLDALLQYRLMNRMVQNIS